LLWRISTLDLDLLPTHPDRLGGLGFLLSIQKDFGILAAALGSVVAGQFANEIVHFGERFRVMVAPMAVFVAGAVIIILFPLTFFSRKLFKARHISLVRYSVVGRHVTHKFDFKWIRRLGLPPESMIGTQDASSLIDYISSYDVIRQTRTIPITKGAVMHVAILAAAPFAFVWALATPLEKVVEEILKRMF
jgi:MFS family permease